jgi:glycosyltransferase involved in cell wall biosynthesis
VGTSLAVDPYDPQAIADKIRWILANRNEAEQMGKIGQIAVMEQFSWKSESRKLVALYRTILAVRA